ncbi:MAG: S-adenosylmethionine decarboxylase family protein [Gemmataceae bacterium]
MKLSTKKQAPALTLAGTEWLVDALGCRPAPLRDVATLERLCDEIIADLDLHVVGAPHWHAFDDPGGVTGLYLLTESHLACHTYPELGVATFNLYCCRARPHWDWEERLAAWLGAAQVDIRTLTRGEEGGRAQR